MSDRIQEIRARADKITMALRTYAERWERQYPVTCDALCDAADLIESLESELAGLWEIVSRVRQCNASTTVENVVLECDIGVRPHVESEIARSLVESIVKEKAFVLQRCERTELDCVEFRGCIDVVMPAAPDDRKEGE